MINKKQIGEGQLTEEQEIYRENILDHYKHPRNVGAIKNCLHQHRELNPLCGDELELFLEVENNKIVKVFFSGAGCAISQAAMSMLTEKIKGMGVEEAMKLQSEDIVDMLGIPIGVVRMKCALLCLKTLHGSLKGGSHDAYA
jgi:nitrogen fixation NifU-like protein